MSKWKPTKKKNPKQGGWYLVTMNGEICGLDKPIVGMCEYSLGHWMDGETGEVIIDDMVLAWRYMPKPYKGN